MELKPQQQEAVDAALAWYKNRPTEPFLICGAAGTGKTVTLTTLARLIPQSEVIAFTGKAASVLRKKGVHRATTIHRAIYHYLGEKDDDLQFEKQRDTGAKCFMVDECSMVNQKIMDDLQSFGIPILLVGDYNQLPPVSDKKFIIDDPDYVLTEIIRQGKGSPIIDLAWRIKAGEHLKPYHEENEEGSVEVKFLNGSPWLNDGSEIVLCGRVETRKRINRMYREKLGYNNTINAGDRIICSYNNQHLGVVNGMPFTVTKADCPWDTRIAEIEVDSDGHRRKFSIWTPSLESLKHEKVPQEIMEAQFAYGLTVHKAQGSEWDSVSVIATNSEYQWMREDARKWLYTAVTRAKKKLIVYI